MPKGLRIPNDWEEEDGYITVLFCMPNSPQWRRIVVGHIEALSYGRAWNGETGTITDTQDIAGRMFETMQICDLETPLNRIADALDGGAEQRYTIGDIVTALEEIDTGLDIVDFLDFFEFLSVLLSKFPSLNFTISIPELLKMLTDFRYRASSLNYLEDIALSQRGSMIAQGGLPIQGIYENVGDTFNAAAAGLTGGQSAGIQWLFQVIKGKDIQIGQDLLDALNAVLFGSMRDAQYEIAEDVTSATSAIEDLATQLGLDLSDLSEAMTVTVNNDVTCGSCGSGGGCKCNPEVSGPVTDVAEKTVGECCIPDGFEYMAEYDTYFGQFANWLIDKQLIAVKQLELLYLNLFDTLLAQADGEQPLSITEAYRDIAVELDRAINPVMLATITNEDRSSLITLLANHFRETQNAVATNVPEVQTLDQVMADYWIDNFGPAVAWLQTNSETQKEAVFDANTATDVLDSLSAMLATMGQQAAGIQSEIVGSVLEHLATMGMANLGFFRSDNIDGYDGGYELLGSKCPCTHDLQAGTEINTWEYQSEEIDPGVHLVHIYFYALGCGEGAGTAVYPDILVLGNWTPSSTQDDSFVLHNGVQTIYSQDTPWGKGSLGDQIEIYSDTQFIVQLDIKDQVC